MHIQSANFCLMDIWLPVSHKFEYKGAFDRGHHVKYEVQTYVIHPCHDFFAGLLCQRPQPSYSTILTGITCNIEPFTGHAMQRPHKHLGPASSVQHHRSQHRKCVSIKYESTYTRDSKPRQLDWYLKSYFYISFIDRTCIHVQFSFRARVRTFIPHSNIERLSCRWLAPLKMCAMLASIAPLLSCCISQFVQLVVKILETLSTVGLVVHILGNIVALRFRVVLRLLFLCKLLLV